MNISSTELAALNAILGGVLGQDSTVLSPAIINQLWSTVALQRTGDGPRDPYRTVTSFTTKASALAFGQALKFTDAKDAVLLFNGITLDSVVSGDPGLSDLYCSRAGVPHPAPTAAEVTAVAVEVVKAQPKTLVKRPTPSRNS